MISERFTILLATGSALVVGCLSSIAAGAFYADPPDAHHPWAVHDMNRPQPPRVEPAPVVGGAPSDAIVLFDGTEASLQNWIHEKPADKRKKDWVVKDGALQCSPGAGFIATKEAFSDCQLHVEWMAPKLCQWRAACRTCFCSPRKAPWIWAACPR